MIRSLHSSSFRFGLIVLTLLVGCSAASTDAPDGGVEPTDDAGNDPDGGVESPDAAVDAEVDPCEGTYLDVTVGIDHAVLTGVCTANIPFVSLEHPSAWTTFQQQSGALLAVDVAACGTSGGQLGLEISGPASVGSASSGTLTYTTPSGASWFAMGTTVQTTFTRFDADWHGLIEGTLTATVAPNGPGGGTAELSAKFSLCRAGDRYSK